MTTSPKDLHERMRRLHSGYNPCISDGAPLSVTFSDLSTGSPTSWLWDFGDGSPPVNSRKNCRDAPGGVGFVARKQPAASNELVAITPQLVLGESGSAAAKT